MTRTPDSAASWDAYWQGGRHGAALTGGAGAHPAVAAFWRDFFASLGEALDGARIVDVGSGNGALTETVTAVAADRGVQLTCLDISAAAVRELTRRFQDIQGVVADAADIPLESASVDIAISQFGVEYAGLGALAEMRRLLRPGGRLACLLHHREGGIYRECAVNRDAMERLRQSAFLPLSRELFEAGFAACRGGDRGPYDRAARRLAPAIRELQAILTEHGPEVADGLPLHLQRDVRRLHDRMPQHEEAPVLDWLEKMTAEVDAYAKRMEAMCNAAVSGEQFRRLCRELEDSDGTLDRADALLDPEHELPLAWALVCTAG